MLRSLLLVAALTAVPTTLEAGSLAFRLRDSQTGYPLVGNVKYAWADEGWGNPTSAYSASDGWFRRQLADGHYLVQVSVPGYKTMRSYILARDNPMPMAFMMSPEQDTYEFGDERVEALLRPGRCLVQGFVLDAETLEPLSGVEVEVTPPGARTTTNRRGFYELSVPVSAAEYPMIDLTFRITGYGTEVNRNILVASGQNGGRRAELVRGGPPVERDLTHKLLRHDPTPTVQAPAAPNPAYRRPQAVLDWLSETPRD